MEGFLMLVLLALVSAGLAEKLEADPALFPLPVLGGCSVVLLCFGYAGLLLPGLWAVLLGLAGFGGWQLYRNGVRPTLRVLATPAFLIFAAATAGIWVLFALRQPMFVQWDEFTFWGTACRMLKEQNALYPGAPGNLAARAYMPGMMLVSYLFQALGSFAEWKVLAAYDILFFASMAMVIAVPRKHWPLAAVLSVGLFLLPFFFSAPPAGAASYVYRNAMGDLPLAMLFGGAACLWLRLGHTRGGKVLFVLCLCMLTLTKDMGLAYALILVGVAFLTGCVDGEKVTVKGCLKSLGTAILMAVPVPVLYLTWSRYCLLTSGADKAAVGSSQVSYGGILIGGVQQLLGIGRTEEFAQIMQLMADAFFGRTVCLLGSGAVAVVLILIVAAAAFAAAQKGSGRRGAAAVTIGLAGAFVVFYLFHLFLYYYNFAQAEALILKDYERYITPYYIGWMLTELCLLAQAVEQGSLPRLARVSAVGVTSLLALAFCWRGIPGSSFWDDADSLYLLRKDVKAKAQAMNQVLNWEDDVLVLSQGDDATRWYYYCYELNATVTKGFGGRIGGEDDVESGWPSTFMNLVDSLDRQLYDYQAATTAEGLMGYLRAKGCDYLLIDRADDFLVNELGPYCEGGLQLQMKPTLYRIVDGGGTEMRFEVAAVAD